MLELIQGVEILGSLGIAKTKELMQYARKLRVKKDQIVVKQGTKGRKVYVVAMGFLTASINGRPTRTLTVSDMFGDVEALFGKIYSATYRTSTGLE
mmetsp:Transcript_5878/g.8700  ORF Transcript_5878/g.8700 Transcript_5878/m.8700 type:complete len:96 (-) Transcript_5878:677-964(-)